MRTDIWNRRAGWLGMVAWVLFSGVLAQAQVPEVDQPRVNRPEATPLIDDREAIAEGQAAGSNPASEYWIGVATSDELINDTVRAQLGLDKDQGIAVLSVRPDSPAAKAGLRENDVLVQAGDRPLQSVQDLIEAVDASNGNDVSIVLYREGQRQTLTVTPAKRPADMQRLPQETFRNWIRNRASGGPDDVIIDRWFSGKDGGPLGMWMVRPGMVLPPGARSQPLPENMTVTITKRGKEPAKISVRRDGESWDVTEETLSELPADVRVHVESMLAHHVPAFGVRVNPPTVERFPRPTPPPAEPTAENQNRDNRRGGDARQLDDVQKQVQKLRQSVEELKRLLKDKNQ